MSSNDPLVDTDKLAELCNVPRGVIEGLMTENAIQPMIKRGKYIRWDFRTVKEQLKLKHRKPLRT